MTDYTDEDLPGADDEPEEDEGLFEDEWADERLDGRALGVGRWG